MQNRANGLAILLLALLIPLAACDTGTSADFGSVSVLLTDAEGDVAKAWVTITDIYLQGAGGDEDPPGGRVFLLEDAEETHELVSLANTVAGLVAEKEVPTGTYGQLRIIISGGCIVTGAGDVFASAGYIECGPANGSLTMPSFAQTGAKVLLNGLTVTGGQHVLLLDFDVSQSFGQVAGASGSWVMTPVIHAAEIELTAGVTVTLDADEVELPEGYALGDFSVTLTPAVGDASELAFTEADGVFRAQFQFLIPGNGPFEAVLNVPEDLTVVVSPESPASESPASGQTATIDWVIQSAEEDVPVF